MKNILKCVIIDDEQHAIDLLADYIAELPSLSLYKTFRNPLLALDDISAEDDIDIVFLDVQMPGITGLELARSLRSKTKKMVIVTAHAHHTMEAFGVHADRYLLKPIRLDTFAHEMRELIDAIMLIKTAQASLAVLPPDFFYIRVDDKKIRVNMADIIVVEGLKNYVNIYTKNEKFTTYLTMTEIERALAPDGRFMRVHKSFIIKMEEIRKITGNTICLNNGTEILLGGVYKEGFNTYLKEFTLTTGRR